MNDWTWLSKIFDTLEAFTRDAEQFAHALRDQRDDPDIDYYGFRRLEMALANFSPPPLPQHRTRISFSVFEALAALHDVRKFVGSDPSLSIRQSLYCLRSAEECLLRAGRRCNAPVIDVTPYLANDNVKPSGAALEEGR